MADARFPTWLDRVPASKDVRRALEHAAHLADHPVPQPSRRRRAALWLRLADQHAAAAARETRRPPAIAQAQFPWRGAYVSCWSPRGAAEAAHRRRRLDHAEDAPRSGAHRAAATAPAPAAADLDTAGLRDRRETMTYDRQLRRGAGASPARRRGPQDRIRPSLTPATTCSSPARCPGTTTALRRCCFTSTRAATTASVVARAATSSNGSTTSTASTRGRRWRCSTPATNGSSDPPAGTVSTMRSEVRQQERSEPARPDRTPEPRVRAALREAWRVRQAAAPGGEGRRLSAADRGIDGAQLGDVAGHTPFNPDNWSSTYVTAGSPTTSSSTRAWPAGETARRSPTRSSGAWCCPSETQTTR